MKIDIGGVVVELLHKKALYIPDERLLVIADVHLGKANHFRKNGVAIPAHVQRDDYDNLQALIDEIKPAKVYFLGDLFHSDFNNDWHNFCDLIGANPSIQFTLIKGNHDIINQQKFGELCIDVVDMIEDNVFVYTHEPFKNVPAGKVNMVGHIHPGVVLSGMGRQSMKLPCFYREKQLLILPAFGVLTGLYNMDAQKAMAIYLVLGDSVRML